MARKKIKIEKKELDLLDKYVRRISGSTDREAMKELLKELIINNAIPIELLKTIPMPPQKVGKTRFDQLYDAAMHLVFPDYRKTTIETLLGPDCNENNDIRVWRAIFPERFKLTHVLIRAPTYQQAFALACDYACRVSLRLFNHIPPDLTIRIMFMSDPSIRRHLALREINRNNKRHEFQLEGRTFTHKQLSGARIAALGPNNTPNHSIFKYAEMKDLRRISQLRNTERKSSIESESFRPEGRKEKRVVK